MMKNVPKGFFNISQNRFFEIMVKLNIQSRFPQDESLKSLDRYIDIQINIYIVRKINRQIDGQIDRWIDRQMDR